MSHPPPRARREPVTCPACHKSRGVAAAVEAGARCPNCGLTAATLLQVLAVQRQEPTEATRDRLAAVLIEADVLQRALDTAVGGLTGISVILSGNGRPS